MVVVVPVVDVVHPDLTVVDAVVAAADPVGTVGDDDAAVVVVVVLVEVEEVPVMDRRSLAASFHPGMLLGMLLPLGMLLMPLLLRRASCASKSMLLLLLLFPQLLRWEQQPQRASMKEAMASKAPGPRRLDEDGPRELDDIVVAIPVDALDVNLHIRWNDVLLTVSMMTMQEGLSRDDLGDHADPIVEDVCSMNWALMKPSKML